MIVFVDVETTGLFENEGHLLEVALVLTDDDLNEVAHVSTLVRPVGRDVDALQMDDVVRAMHIKNGLLDELKRPGVPRRYEAEALLVEWVKKAFEGVPDVATEKCVHCDKRQEQHEMDTIAAHARRDPVPQRSCERGYLYGGFPAAFSPKFVSALSVMPLAGSTVSFDRRWLRQHMPELEKLFSHRSVDVSSVGELAARWAPEVYAGRPRSTDQHRALADARGSIELLRYYRAQDFIKPARYLTAEQILSFSTDRAKVSLVSLSLGNSARVAVDADWREENGVLRCQARGGSSDWMCGIMVKHTGTPHRFCMRAPHEGYCDARCFQERCP